MIGPFPRRVISRIVAAALAIAALLALAGTSIPIPTTSETGLDDRDRFVIDPDASGPTLGSTFSIPDAQPAAAGGTFADLMELRVVAGEERPRLIIVDLFATWCPPCQQETPTLRSLDRAYRDAGLLIVGVSVQELPETVRDYVARYDLEYPVLLDLDGAIFRAAMAGGLPTKVFLDGEGRVIRVLPRPLTAGDGPLLIAPLLESP